MPDSPVLVGFGFDFVGLEGAAVESLPLLVLGAIVWNNWKCWGLRSSDIFLAVMAEGLLLSICNRSSDEQQGGISLHSYGNGSKN